MDYTQKQRHIISLVDEFCDQYLSEEQIKQWVHARGIPSHVEQVFHSTELWKYLLIPAAGGFESDMVERALVIEHLTRRAGATLPALSDAVSMAFLATMRRMSQAEIADELISAGGRFGFAEAFSDTDQGPQGSAATAEVAVTPEGLFLSGEVMYVAGGQFMPEALVLARCPAVEGSENGLALWLVPLDMPGVSTYPLEVVGQEMLCPARIVFDAVELKPFWRIETEGHLDEMLKRDYELSRILICASSLGLAKAANDDVIAFARANPGQASDPRLQDRLAEMQIRIYSMEHFVYQAARHVYDGTAESHIMCALMKRFVPAASTETASLAMEALGGAGYTRDLRVGRIWRDCRGNQVTCGSSDLMSAIATEYILRG